MFIEQLTKEPLYFTMVMIVVIVSIVLHELAHGFAAIWQGDDTPRLTGHITLNPLIHMGWMALAMLAICGISWGSTPVDPTRFRSRYGDAMVSAAGPAMNLLLAFLGLTALAVMAYLGGENAGHAWKNAQQILWTLGFLNLALAMFNLLPVPPLDGSKIVMNFVPALRSLAQSGQGLLGIVALVLIFRGARWIMEAAANLSGDYVAWVVAWLVRLAG